MLSDMLAPSPRLFARICLPDMFPKGFCPPSRVVPCRCWTYLGVRFVSDVVSLLVRCAPLSYFATVPDDAADPELLKLGTDKSLFADPGFLPFAQKYRDSQDDFFEAYKKVMTYMMISYVDVLGLETPPHRACDWEGYPRLAQGQLSINVRLSDHSDVDCNSPPTGSFKEDSLTTNDEA